MNVVAVVKENYYGNFVCAKLVTNCITKNDCTASGNS